MAPTVQPDETSTSVRSPGPVRTALLVCLGWYVAIGLAFAGYAARLPKAPDTGDCTGFCISPRSGYLAVGLVHGLPVIVGCLLVSLVVIAVLRRRIRSAFLLGSLAAFAPALLLTPVVQIAHG